MERFVAVLLEHTAGNLPLWLTPDQCVVLPVGEKYVDFAKKVCSSLKNSEIRTALDDRNETIGKRIRENELKKMPYLLVVGEKEMESGSVSVRQQGGHDLGFMKIEEFANLIGERIREELGEPVKPADA